jgi:anaerobic selenocysteine-containing dehydrogenase
MSWAKEQLATVDLARARFVISFGADFLGTWNSPVAQSVGYGAMRQARPGVRGAFVQVESRMSLTGASADQWIPVKPGTEGVLALGLAHVILANKLRPAATGPVAESIAGWSNGLSDYTPARVEQITGVAAKRVERLARELTDVSPAVAIVGGACLQTNAIFTALAVNAQRIAGRGAYARQFVLTPGGDTSSRSVHG